MGRGIKAAEVDPLVEFALLHLRLAGHLEVLIDLMRLKLEDDQREGALVASGGERGTGEVAQTGLAQARLDLGLPLMDWSWLDLALPLDGTGAPGSVPSDRDLVLDHAYRHGPSRIAWAQSLAGRGPSQDQVLHRVLRRAAGRVGGVLWFDAEEERENLLLIYLEHLADPANATMAQNILPAPLFDALQENRATARPRSPGSMAKALVGLLAPPRPKQRRRKSPLAASRSSLAPSFGGPIEAHGRGIAEPDVEALVQFTQLWLTFVREPSVWIEFLQKLPKLGIGDPTALDEARAGMKLPTFEWSWLMQTPGLGADAQSVLRAAHGDAAAQSAWLEQLRSRPLPVERDVLSYAIRVAAGLSVKARVGVDLGHVLALLCCEYLRARTLKSECDELDRVKATLSPEMQQAWDDAILEVRSGRGGARRLAYMLVGELFGVSDSTVREWLKEARGRRGR